MPCSLKYIPEHLHTNGRPDLPEFWLGEYLYRRCKEKDKENPFLNMSLVDISVNRSGKPGAILSIMEDVLFNTNPKSEDEPERHEEAITTLQIKELTKENIYHKVYSHEKSDSAAAKLEKETHSCTILLKHKKEECNYSHSAFEIYFDDIFLDFDNYKHLLKKHTPLKTWCKNELTKMIIKEEVRINWDN